MSHPENFYLVPDFRFNGVNKSLVAWKAIPNVCCDNSSEKVMEFIYLEKFIRNLLKTLQMWLLMNLPKSYSLP